MRRRALARVAPHEWLLLLVLVVLADRYRWLMDDAFIYFRYVDNLVLLGRGLVYNPGEYVEGFTSPAWTLVLAALRSLQLDYWTVLRGATVVFAATFWALAVAIDVTASPEGARRVNAPLAVACAHYGVTTHLSSGLETPLVELAAAVFALAALRPRAPALLVLIGLAPLVRPELALPCVIYTAWWCVTQRRMPWLLTASGLLCNGAWLLFRVYYYADFWPNTYYLKGTRAWHQGLLYLVNAAPPGQAALLALLLGLAIWRRAALRETLSARACMLLCAAAVAIWVARIGGDMLFFRYAAFPFCLVLFAGAGVVERALATVARPKPRWLELALAVALMLTSLASYPPQLLGHPLTEPRTRQVHKIAEAQWHRRQTDLAYSKRNVRFDRKLRAKYRKPALAPAVRPEVLDSGWCRRGFAAFDRYVINSFGLTDAILARIDVPAQRPGHKNLSQHSKALAKLRRSYDPTEEASIFQQAVDDHAAPRWVRRQLPKLAWLERKIHNRHDLVENFELAWRARKIRHLRP